MNELTNPNPPSHPQQPQPSLAPASHLPGSSPSRPAARRRRSIRRNGCIASLPKPQRDMVNRMLANGIPYKNIVAALANAGFTVTARNISNSARSGYLEWFLAQEQLSHQRFKQDHMLDSLRRDDAADLPEVGLQAAATRPGNLTPPA